MKYFTAITLLLPACVPSFVDEPWRVTTARVLAVKSEPAEAAPGTTFTLRALVADASDSDTAIEPAWRLCNAPKPLGENNAVAAGCLRPENLGPELTGTSVTFATSTDSCVRFGPDASGDGYRPRAPDASGGYYQPVRVDLPGAAPVFHQVRLRCRLAEAPLSLAVEFAKNYASNANPRLLSLNASLNGRPIELSKLQAGDAAILTAEWSTESTESYANFDRKQQAIVEMRETLQVDWYVSAGTLETSTTLFDSENTAPQANNVWLAPKDASEVSLWVVLRDSRGGSDFITQAWHVSE